MALSYSAVVIGSGQSGTPLATAFAKAGHKTALIEATHIGGTCVNEGCTPTKTMVASARVAHVMSRAEEFGIETAGAFKTNMQTIRQRKRDIVDSFRGGSEARLKSTENLNVHMGKARLIGPKEIEVVANETNQKTIITADRVFINVGCRPTPLNIPGAQDVTILDSTSVMELDIVPRRLIVIGGGYVGIEFAQMFRRFGSEVIIVQRSGQLMPREDVDVAEAVKKILEDDGLEISLNSNPLSISKTTEGIALDVTVAGAKQTIEGSHVLSAAGRIPNTDHLEASAAGLVLYGPGFVKTNELLETNVSGLYALGDVKGGPAFTHISYDDFRILQYNLIDQNSGLSNSLVTPLTTSGRIVPYTVFMDPQLGRVGISESEARKIMQSEPGRKLRVAKMPFAYVARALEMDESRGFMKIIVDEDSKKILGAMFLGIEGGEMMAMIQIAMMGGVTYDRLRDGVFSHPNLSESLNNVWGFLEDIV